MAVSYITKENFEQEVLNANKPVLIDFWAEWCAPCKMLSPVISELGDEVKDAKICKVNVDEQPELAAKFRVASIPMLVLIKDGQVVNSSVGLQPKKNIVNMINKAV